MSVEIVALDGFDDPAFTDEDRARLAGAGGTDCVFTTAAWCSSWWAAFGRGDLLLLGARRDGDWVAYASFFAEAGMVFFIGSGGSDYLDLLGDVSDPDVLEALLAAAVERTPGFLGFRLYHVPDASKTGAALQAVAERMGLQCYDEGSLGAPFLDLTSEQDALAALKKKSLLRSERRMARDGELEVRHLTRAPDVLFELDRFFDQHIARWDGTGSPSLFLDPHQRRFYELVTEAGARAGWLRFTAVLWDGEPVSYHFGFCYRDSYLWYKPSYSIEHARFSPGEVLLRNLILAARGEGARRFDLGLGDEAFKARFTSGVDHVRTWGLYPWETP